MNRSHTFFEKTIHLRTLSEGVAIVLLCLVFFSLCLLKEVKASETDAAKTVENFHAALIKSMKNADRLCFDGRYKLLAPVMTDSFALSFMTEKSVGRFWKKLSKKEKLLLKKKYAHWSISQYAYNFDGYSGEKFETISETMVGKNRAQIVSRLVAPGRDNHKFLYRLKKIGGNWRVVDIQIDGVSQLILARSQYLPLIKKKGFKSLIDSLESAINKLSKGPQCQYPAD